MYVCIYNVCGMFIWQNDDNVDDQDDLPTSNGLEESGVELLQAENSFQFVDAMLVELSTYGCTIEAGTHKNMHTYIHTYIHIYIHNVNSFRT
jgi:hypothetical protein